MIEASEFILSLSPYRKAVAFQKKTFRVLRYCCKNTLSYSVTFNAKQYPTEVGKSFSIIFIIMKYS